LGGRILEIALCRPHVLSFVSSTRPLILSPMPPAPLSPKSPCTFEKIAQLLNSTDQSFKANQPRRSLEATPIAPLRPLLQKSKLGFEAKGAVEVQMPEFAESTRALFAQALPLYFRAPSALSLCRTQVIEKCAQIAELRRSSVEFDSTLECLRATAVRFNRELRELHGALNLRFREAFE
jgi:hypothetical protein